MTLPSSGYLRALVCADRETTEVSRIEILGIAACAVGAVWVAALASHLRGCCGTGPGRPIELLALALCGAAILVVGTGLSDGREQFLVESTGEPLSTPARLWVGCWPTFSMIFLLGMQVLLWSRSTWVEHRLWARIAAEVGGPISVAVAGALAVSLVRVRGPRSGSSSTT